jgi:hypothetical protein
VDLDPLPLWRLITPNCAWFERGGCRARYGIDAQRGWCSPTDAAPFNGRYPQLCGETPCTEPVRFLPETLIPLSHLAPWLGQERRLHRSLWLAWALLVTYLASRLVNLGLLPMVSDEGTYLSWGVRALYSTSAEDWLASLEDGKQPLLAWLMPPFLALIDDRLVAGRLVSVCTGLANLGLMVLLGRRLFSQTAGWIAGGLYVVAPIALVHDRMALYDSLVATAALLVLLGALLWAERPDAGRTAFLGVGMGLALLTKLSALFFVALVPVAIGWWRPSALRHWWLLAQSFFLAAAFYSVLYLSPIVDNIQDGNFQRYSLTASEVVRMPVSIWASNAAFIVEAGSVYLGGPLALLCAVSIGLSVVRAGRAGQVSALWIVIPLLAFVLTAKIIYSRYVVFCFVVALLPAAWALETWGRRILLFTSHRVAAFTLGAAVVIAVTAPGMLFAYRLLSDPASAPWMNNRRYITDRFQYIESNYAGYGLNEMVSHLRGQAQQRPIVVLTRNTTGMPRDGIAAYLQSVPDIHVGLVPEHEGVEAHMLRERGRAYQMATQGHDIYYVLTDAPNGEQMRRFRAQNPSVRLIKEIPKPGDHSRFQLYHMIWTRPTTDVWFNAPIRLGDRIQLAGFDLDGRSAKPGETVRLTLYWETSGRAGIDYTVFNHIVDVSGQRLGQRDGQPANGRQPTSRWRPGELVADTHEIVISSDASPGTYLVISGMYDLRTMHRLPVQQGGSGPSDHVVVGRIEVTSP